MRAMKPGDTIPIEGQPWTVRTAQPKRLVLVRTPEADLLREWRARHGYTTREAAMRLGISQAQVTRIEHGQRSCPADVLEKISRAPAARQTP